MRERVDPTPAVLRSDGPARATDGAPLADRGEMEALVRAFDWSTTPLGAVETWPQSLKTPVRILLTSRFAMWMGWGPELTFLYNDAYGQMTLGEKHPWALGRPSREVWAEIWPDIGPRIQRVLDTGVATWDEELLLFLERSGYPEETYHTFSYSPLADDAGHVAGHLCVVTEETERVIGERRLATLRELAAALASTTTEEGVLAAIERSVGGNDKDLPFTLTYLFETEDEGAGVRARLVSRTGIDESHPAAAPVIEIVARNGDDAPAAAWPAAALLETSASIIVDDLAARFGALPTGAWDAPPRRAIVVPVAQQGQERPAGFLVAAINPYRPFDAAYAGFVDLVAGQIAASLANARAYEEERRRARALAELDRAKTQFFSNVSHEFRTPLTLMLGPAEDALADGGTTAQNRERVEVIHRNALRLLKLVNTLLDFSRIEAGRVDASYVPTDLAALTTELASTFRSAIERAGLRLVIDAPALPDDLPPVYVDRDMWEKIVLNLLSNAFKHTFEGEVAVALRPAEDGRHIELTIRDTGVGIPADQLPHLFERFHRVPNARSRTHEGTGIGLALVQELVKLHGGRVEAASEEGTGTTFTVYVPLGLTHLPGEQVSARDTDGRRTRTSASTALGAAAYTGEALRWLPDPALGTGDSALDRRVEPGAPGALYPPFENGGYRAPGTDRVPSADSPVRSARILLADDNADLRDYVARLLRGRGWTVEVVSDGAAALEAARREPPDLVLSDVMMPGLDGFRLLAALRDGAATRTVPVILLSARAGEEARVGGMEAGADDYLIKPFSARELVARVGAHLALAEARARATAQVEAARAELEAANEQLQEQTVELEAANEQLQDQTVELEAQKAELEATTEELVQQSEARQQFVTLVENSADFIGMAALDGPAFYVNAAGRNLLGLPDADAVRGTAMPDYVTPASQRLLLETALPAVLRDGVWRGEIEFRHFGTGEPIAVDQIIFPVVDLASGTPLCFATVARDVRERKRIEAEREVLLERERSARAEAEAARSAAEVANKTKSDFLAAMSHELRTPLNAIAGHVQLLEMEIHGPVTDAQRESLARVQRSQEHLLALINDVLNFAKLEAGRVEYRADPVALADIVADLAPMIEPQLAAKGLAYDVRVAPELVARADREKVQQVLLNLLSNAVKFTERGGRITVDAATREEGADGGRPGVVFVRVSDTGPGIPREKQEVIFEPFVQLDRKLTRATDGTGLGLAISRDLARGMGGELRVRSVVGEGSTFTLALPRA